MNNISAVITTDNNYTGLYNTLQSVLMSTILPSEIIIYDDTVESKRKKNLLFTKRFSLLADMADVFNCDIKIKKTERLGSIENNQQSLFDAKCDYIYRISDNMVCQNNTIQILLSEMKEEISAIGSLVLKPGRIATTKRRTQSINETAHHVQTYQHLIKYPFPVECLMGSYLYRKTKSNYGDRLLDNSYDDIIYTHEMYREGYKLMVAPAAIVWNMSNVDIIPSEKDKNVMTNKRKIWDMIDKDDIVIVDNLGIGDSIVLKSCFEKLSVQNITKKIWIFTRNIEVYKIGKIQYPRVGFLGLNEAALYFGGRPPNNIYVWMEERNWKKTLQEAYMNMLGIKEEV